MITEQVQRDEASVVVACRSLATADVVATLLATHGIQASVTALSIYPSVEWAQGRQVSVAVEDVDRAREVLAVMSGERDDVVFVDELDPARVDEPTTAPEHADLPEPDVPVTTPVAPLMGVTELGIGLGTHEGNRFLLLSLERWESWFDLRFARIADPGATPLPRRVPPAESWLVRDDLGTTYEVVDVTGRGDRAFSSGDVRLRPALSLAATELTVAVLPTPSATPLARTFSAL